MRACARSVLLFFLMAALLPLAVAKAADSPTAAAKASLDTSLQAVLAVLKRPAYADPSARPALRKEIEAIVRTKFDFFEFSLRTVGQRWQTFTQKQKDAFADAFAELLIQTYVNKIDGYNGEKINFTGEKASSKGDRVEVLTLVTLKDGKKIPVAYRMLPKNNDWKVYDVLIENISLVKNYRTQFQELLKTGTPEAVIERIRAKALEVSHAAQKSGTK